MESNNTDANLGSEAHSALEPEVNEGASPDNATPTLTTQQEDPKEQEYNRWLQWNEFKLVPLFLVAIVLRMD